LWFYRSRCSNVAPSDATAQQINASSNFVAKLGGEK
jgi:hypothetical protein